MLDTQIAGVGVPGRGDSADDAALPDAATKPGLHWRDEGQAPRRARWAAEGACDRRQGKPSEAAMVEVAGMAWVPKTGNTRFGSAVEFAG